MSALPLAEGLNGAYTPIDPALATLATTYVTRHLDGDDKHMVLAMLFGKGDR